MLNRDDDLIIELSFVEDVKVGLPSAAALSAPNWYNIALTSE